MTKYSEWLHYFHHNAWNPSSFPFASSPTLPPAEAELLASSLQQFQLGEGSDGAGLLRRSAQFGLRNGIDRFADAMTLFIREEQRHSAVLGLFLDQEMIPRLRSHWVDRAFRRIRNLADFELMVTVLVSAEFIAVPYYTAIHDVTSSMTLKRIAKRILLDEEQHLEFQAENLALCARDRGDLARFLTIFLQMSALTAASLLVYLMHRKLFAAASMSALRFWALALEAHRPVLRKLSRHGRTQAPCPALR